MTNHRIHFRDGDGLYLCGANRRFENFKSIPAYSPDQVTCRNCRRILAGRNEVEQLRAENLRLRAEVDRLRMAESKRVAWRAWEEKSRRKSNRVLIVFTVEI